MEALEDLPGGTLCTEKEEIRTETMLKQKRNEVSKQEATLNTIGRQYASSKEGRRQAE